MSQGIEQAGIYSVAVRRRRCECFHWIHDPMKTLLSMCGGTSNDHKTNKVVCTFCKVSMKCHLSTSTIQEHAKKCTVEDEGAEKISNIS